MPFSAILPRVKTLRVRVAVTVTCVSFWLFAGAIFYHGATAVGLIVAAAFAVTAIYLWRLRAWARRSQHSASRLRFSFSCVAGYLIRFP